jgi:hypothetical protein
VAVVMQTVLQLTCTARGDMRAETQYNKLFMKLTITKCCMNSTSANCAPLLMVNHCSIHVGSSCCSCRSFGGLRLLAS